MKLLLWHVHGSWTTSFVQGGHDYVVPVLPDRGPDGRGRARTFPWPQNVRELPPEALADEPFDAVILQRPQELGTLAEQWLRRRPGRDLPAVYVEHNAPQGRIAELRHPAAGRRDLTLVHVTHFNELFWDAAGTRTRVIEHGIVDPGYRYGGELARAGVVINEARRRGRVTGTDLLPRLEAGGVPYDLFGIDAAALGGIDDPPQAQLHEELPRRRVYVHPIRWTSLGLALIEAMALGMPVAVLATTEAAHVIPATAGVVTADAGALIAGARRLLDDPEEARERGLIARAVAAERFALERFLGDWDQLLEEVAG